ncbi:pyruvate kinase [Methanococcus maripaludis]|uniref:Pyruvate kinase n=1 Tax=Methanococcus maripaludis TaxID=39152 RepID=A0A8T3W7Q4_METMI|nr:pyruvate kinase [Methanococcus maripaludis]MBG0769203.1 pyruvate kinase [Methanococcus maripaludis]
MVEKSTEYRKTKILVTMGPSLDGTFEKSLEFIDGIRFNMSHANTKSIEKYLDILNEKNIAKLMDLKGNKIRIKKSNFSELIENQVVKLGKDILISYIPECIEKDQNILINDGKIKLIVESVEKDITARVLVGGHIKEKMGVNFPEGCFPNDLTDEDIKNVKFAVENEFEYIALSFVRSEKDILNLKNLIKEYSGNCSVIAKIETKEGLKNIDEILNHSDGVMIARGDLGVEVAIEYLPIIQKNIIKLANEKGKLVITATQMLDSMVNNPYPTRAEVTDVANAIFDGTDCLMLSNETTIGKYPIYSIKTLDNIARVSENDISKYKQEIEFEEHSIYSGIAYAVEALSKKLNPKIVITPTTSGKTPLRISKFRFNSPIIALAPENIVFRKLRLVWGVIPIKIDEIGDVDEVLEISKKIAKNIIDSGIYVVTLGHPKGEKKTNVIKVESI